MVRCLKIKKEKGELARRFLEKKIWFDRTRLLGKTEKRYLIIPLNPEADEKAIKKKFSDAKFENKNLRLLPVRPGNLKYLLKDILTERQTDQIVRSYDTVGDIVVLDIPKRLERLDKSIGWAFKRAHPYVKVVAKKAGKVKGKYRARELKVLTGEKRLHTTYTEAGIPMKLDLGKVFFTPRLGRERQRIANLVKRKEKVLVMFSGIGPFPLMIAKEEPTCRIWAVELNPDAYKNMEDNIRINRMGHIITSVKGDVVKEVPKIGEYFDRIIMPLPEKAWSYLELALRYTKPQGMVHFYAFVHEEKVKDAIEKIKQKAKKVRKKAKIVNWVRAGSYAARTWRFCFDIKVF